MTDRTRLLHETFKRCGFHSRMTLSQSEVFRAAIRQAVEKLVYADLHLRCEDDPASVHEARVATRMLRCDLRLFRPVLDPRWVAQVDGRLKRLAALLGAVRDTDVLVERVRKLAKQLPAEHAADADRIAGKLCGIRATAGAALRADILAGWYAELLGTLVAAERDTKGGRLVAPDRRLQRPEVVVELVQPSWKKLKRAVHRAGRGTGRAQPHRIRIRAKACRYAAEAAGPFVARDRQAEFERFMHHIARLQEHLGIVHDLAIGQETLRSIPDLNRAVLDEIAALDAAAAETSEAAWPKTWKKLAGRKSRFW